MEDKLYEKSMTHTYYQANLYGTFERTFARDHNFKAMVGFNWETNSSRTWPQRVTTCSPKRSTT